ncbi:MAG TPA: helix-turn-helix domain-containing protein [Xanthobacteraceae bacterium]
MALILSLPSIEQANAPAVPMRNSLITIKLPHGFSGKMLQNLLEDERMTKNSASGGGYGPAIRAIDPWASSVGHAHQLLSEDERARLAVMASIARFRKGETIYREGDYADAVFNIISGVVASWKPAPDGREHIVAFLFFDDLFGLSAEGRYANSSKAITAVTAYRLPVIALRSRLSRDAQLEFHVICKLCQELRQVQRHAFLLSEKKAISRLAMFLQMMEQLQLGRGEQSAEIHLPMDRSDIGEYVGMTLAAVSRAFRSLTMRGIIKHRDRRHVSIVDRRAFEAIAGEPIEAPALGSLDHPQ